MSAVAKTLETVGDSTADAIPFAERSTKQTISFVSAGGGTGKSTLSIVAALLCAAQGTKTALVDLDIQFGDIAFAFDIVPKTSFLDLCAADPLRSTDDTRARPQVDIETFAHRAGQDLDLFLSDSQPEHAELILPHVPALIEALQHGYDRVIVNTGAFWTGLHADVLSAADMNFLVFGPHATSVRAALRVQRLMQKLNVPRAKTTHVLNRVTGESMITPLDAEMALQVRRVWPIPEGGREIGDLLGIGRADGLLSGSNPVIYAMDEMLRASEVMLGKKPAAMRAASLAHKRLKRWGT